MDRKAQLKYCLQKKDEAFCRREFHTFHPNRDFENSLLKLVQKICVVCPILFMPYSIPKDMEAKTAMRNKYEMTVSLCGTKLSLKVFPCTQDDHVCE